MRLWKSTSRLGLVKRIHVTGPTPTDRPGFPPSTLIFDVVRLIHATSQISGRATRVWLVSLNDEFYVLKDSWPQASIPFSEIEHLLKIYRTIEGDEKERRNLKHCYPIFVIGQEFSGTTESVRMQVRLADQDVEQIIRLHRRIVTKPFGDPITSFRSKLELCKILCNVVKCRHSF